MNPEGMPIQERDLVIHQENFKASNKFDPDEIGEEGLRKRKEAGSLIEKSRKEEFERLLASAPLEIKEYTKDYPEEIANLKEIASEAGFKNFFISRDVDVVRTFSDFSNDIVFFPAESLENQKILEEADKDLADSGARKIMLHEKGHVVGPAKTASRKADEIYYSDEDHIRADGETMEYEELDNKVESQASLQMLNENLDEFKNKSETTEEGVARGIADMDVYSEALYYGRDNLKREINKEKFKEDYRARFDSVKPEVIDKALEIAIKERKGLLLKIEGKEYENTTDLLEKTREECIKTGLFDENFIEGLEFSIIDEVKREGEEIKKYRLIESGWLLPLSEEEMENKNNVAIFSKSMVKKYQNFSDKDPGDINKLWLKEADMESVFSFGAEAVNEIARKKSSICFGSQDNFNGKKFREEMEKLIEEDKVLQEMTDIDFSKFEFSMQEWSEIYAMLYQREFLRRENRRFFRKENKDNDKSIKEWDKGVLGVAKNLKRGLVKNLYTFMEEDIDKIYQDSHTLSFLLSGALERKSKKFDTRIENMESCARIFQK